MSYGKKSKAVQSESMAAQWFVELDANRTDTTLEAKFCDWLDGDQEREAAYMRCQAAVLLAQKLKDRPKLHRVMREAADLAKEPSPSFQGPPTVAWHQRPVLAWGIAGLSMVVAILALSYRFSEETATEIPASRSPELPLDLALDIPASSPVVVLPGHVVVDAGSVAVLPFESEEGDIPAENQETTARDIANRLYEDVLQELGELPGIYVVNRQSIAAYAGEEMPLGEIAAQLGVRGIVEGSVASQDGRIHVLLRLTDASNDKLVEESFDRATGEFAAMHTDIATNIAVALRNAPLSSE